MTEPSATEAITMVKGAIHNPNEPRHFMSITPAGGSRTAIRGSTQVARSDDAVVVKEVGRGIYNPVVYFDRAGVDMSLLTRTEKSTHCPLKGDTEYFDMTIDGERIADAAWSYVDMITGDDLAGLDELKGRIAFDSSLVTVA